MADWEQQPNVKWPPTFTTSEHRLTNIGLLWQRGLSILTTVLGQATRDINYFPDYRINMDITLRQSPRFQDLSQPLMMLNKTSRQLATYYKCRKGTAEELEELYINAQRLWETQQRVRPINLAQVARAALQQYNFRFQLLPALTWMRHTPTV